MFVVSCHTSWKVWFENSSLCMHTPACCHFLILGGRISVHSSYHVALAGFSFCCCYAVCTLCGLPARACWLHTKGREREGFWSFWATREALPLPFLCTLCSQYVCVCSSIIQSLPLCAGLFACVPHFLFAHTLPASLISSCLVSVSALHTCRRRHCPGFP